MIGMNYMSFTKWPGEWCELVRDFAAVGVAIVAPIAGQPGLRTKPERNMSRYISHEGYELDGFDETVTWGGAVNVGQYSCVINSLGDSMFYNDCVNQGTSVPGNSCTGGIGLCLGLTVNGCGFFRISARLCFNLCLVMDICRLAEALSADW